MDVSDDHVELLKDIQTEWNLAEQDIKVAETVVHNIVFPAIKELRYGGRRIVDALHILTSGDPDPKDQFRILLEEAKFDCRRARHDAVDAASAKISADLDAMVKHIGHGPILQVYADFPELVNRSLDVRDRIQNSRNRRQDREAIYAALEGDEFPVLVSEFNRMKASEAMMIALAKKGRISEFYGKWGFVVGVLALVVSIILAVLTHYKIF